MKPQLRSMFLWSVVVIGILSGICAQGAAQPAAPAAARSIFDGLPPDAKTRYESAAIRLWEGDAPEARGTAPEDVPLLYPVLPATAPVAPLPVMVVIPGGGYNYHSSGEAFSVAEEFRTAGFAAFVLQYRLRPYTPEVALRDTQRAVRLLRERAAALHLDATRIGVIGYSAGGHLAANLSTHGDDGQPGSPDPTERFSCRVQTAILFYPAVVRAPANQLMPAGRGMAAVLEQEGLHRLVSRQTPPTFMIVGYDDSRTPYVHCLAYVARLHEAGVRFELHVLGAGDHGGSVRNARRAEWQPLLKHWLSTVGF